MDREGIILDPCYTAKAFAAVMDHCRDRASGPVLYWHTYNSRDLSGQACTVSGDEMPEKLRCCLSADEAAAVAGGRAAGAGHVRARFCL